MKCQPPGMKRAPGRRGWTPLGAACVAACVVAACLGGGAAPLRQEECAGPTEGYEAAKRALRSGTRALRLYLRAELSAVAGLAHLPATPGPTGPTHPIYADRVLRILEQVEDRMRCLESDVMRLDALDGWEAWRRREEARAARLVRRRLLAVQHPPHCRAARKLVCDLKKGCGFACMAHRIAYCLMVALATQRTLVLNPNHGWSYSPRGWESMFRPLSENCTSAFGIAPVPWPPTLNSSLWINLSSKSEVMSLESIDTMLPPLEFVFPAIPKDLVPGVVRFAREPAAWWAGQALRYVLRPRASLQRAVTDKLNAVNLTSPIVGVHVRRMDKLVAEASFHTLDEYMAHAQDYYDVLELTRSRGLRRVYLATDDPEARKQYPEYQFIGDQQTSEEAAPSRRRNLSTLTGLLVDLNVLVHADFLVATYSSNLGRLALELGGARRDAVSLDRPYMFSASRAPRRTARAHHEPRGARAELAFQAGDLIAIVITSDQLNDYAYGTNLRTNQTGLFPLYKTTPLVECYPFPEYRRPTDDMPPAIRERNEKRGS